jgi:hypothetical protein
MRTCSTYFIFGTIWETKNSNALHHDGRKYKQLKNNFMNTMDLFALILGLIFGFSVANTLLISSVKKWTEYVESKNKLLNVKSKRPTDTITIDVEVNVDKAIIEIQKLQIKALKLEIDLLKEKKDNLE